MRMTDEKKTCCTCGVMEMCLHGEINRLEVCSRYQIEIDDSIFHLHLNDCIMFLIAFYTVSQLLRSQGWSLLLLYSLIFNSPPPVSSAFVPNKSCHA